MKKLLFFFVAFMCINSIAKAQELTKQMFHIYFGQPKTLVQSSDQLQQPMIIEFDKSGRVLSKSFGDEKVVYDWNPDGSSVEVKAYNDGQYMGASMIYIQEMSTERYKYTANGFLYELSFRNNGSINKFTISTNDQSITTNYYYSLSTDAYPYKIVTAGGGQSITTKVSGISKDSQGNCIKFTQSVQEQSMVTTNSITYY